MGSKLRCELWVVKCAMKWKVEEVGFGEGEKRLNLEVEDGEEKVFICILSF